MLRPIDYNALDREFRPGKPLSTEIRRQMVDLYLTEGNLINSSCYLSWAPNEKIVQNNLNIVLLNVF